MKQLIFSLLLMSSFLIGKAQTQFITSANIEFQMRQNQWVDLKGPYAEDIKKNIPQYSEKYFNFQFANGKSIYKPGRETETKSAGFWSGATIQNTVYADYSTGRATAKRLIFEKPYLIEDSLKTAKWKITNDFREIAGFNCRRATTVLFDSVFVVAFYTDEIMIPGGPEGFNGLPGMILGLIINKLHTTWYATKVELNTVKESEIIPPTQKGEKLTRQKFMENIKSVTKNWPNSDQLIWQISF